MRISERFANNYIRAEDMSTPITVTISDVEEVSIGDDDRLVLIFEDNAKVLPLNKTNALALGDLFGDETDEWPGKAITLFKDKVMFNGKRVAAVRIRAASEQPPPRPQHRKVKATDDVSF